MSANWDFYRRRHRIDLLKWKNQKNIQTYSDFLKELRAIAVSPVPPTHPDLVIMGITGGDEARRILEENPAATHGDPSSDFAAFRSAEPKSKKQNKEKQSAFEERKSKPAVEKTAPEAVKEKYKKSELLKMKKGELLALCKTLSVSLSGAKQTKASIISDIMTHQSVV